MVDLSVSIFLTRLCLHYAVSGISYECCLCASFVKVDILYYNIYIYIELYACIN